MSYLYGDSTPSTLEVNFIEFLRDATQFCVQVLLGEQRIAAGSARTLSLDHSTADEIERLKKLGGLVSKALEGAPRADADSATARCAAAIVRAATELVQAETAGALSLLDADSKRRDEEAARERDGCVRALEALLVKHDPPEVSLDLHVAGVSGTRYACRARMTTTYGLEAVVDLEVPANHLLERIVRVDRLAERLEVQAPELGGWLHKEVKLRPQHLEKHYVAELSIGAGGRSTLKLRLAADGSGPGFDVLISKGAPRVRLARVEQREGPPEPPFEVEEADANKLLALYEALAAAAGELTRHRRGIVEAKLDGESLRAVAKPSLLVERLIATMTPVVQEISARSQSPGELVLRRLLADDRREEIFLSKQELKLKLDPLDSGHRALFDPLWLEGIRATEPAPSVSARPPATPSIPYKPSPPTLVTTPQQTTTLAGPPPLPSAGATLVAAAGPTLVAAAGPTLVAAASPTLVAAAGPTLVPGGESPPRRSTGSYVPVTPAAVAAPAQPPPHPTVESPRHEVAGTLEAALTKEADSAPNRG
jgi:hypothetical protein